LKEVSHIYFIGIGGIGMSSIARYFLENGKKVAGYDKVPSQITKDLVAAGAQVHFEDDVAEIPQDYKNQEDTLVIFTPAIPEDHKQLAYFRNHNFRVLKRAQVLGEITKNTFCLAVAGTHGKTTTTAILGHIMKVCNTEATSFLGGISENYHTNLILGKDEVSVVEADEFDRSFLQLAPNVACVTSMDADHLDIYGEKESLEDSFRDFGKKVSGTLIVAKGLPLEGLTYAVNEEADYEIFNVNVENGAYIFDVKTPKSNCVKAIFRLPGKHNLANALAAIALSEQYGVSLSESVQALKSFRGVKRRFSYKVQSEALVLIDDYAHHPTEINAVADAVRELYPFEKVLAIFQPHLFSRTRDFMEDFAHSLSRFDELVLLDIYPARELPIEGVDSNGLLEKVALTKKQCLSKKEIRTVIEKTDARIVVMLGAGDIGVLVEEIAEEINQDL
jgi:UDP-N-acetylmuramate--alanine ligase